MAWMMDSFDGMMAFGAIFMLIIFLLGVFVFVFWLLMLIDCIKRKYKEGIEKLVWVLVIIFTGIIGATIYYFVVKVNDKKK